MTSEFDDEQMQLLRRLPAVRAVTRTRIYYTREFRDEFLRRSAAGHSPTSIFRAFGLDPQVIGAKRIERCADRWRREAERETAGQNGGHTHPTSLMKAADVQYPLAGALLNYRERIVRLEREVDELRRMVRDLQRQQEQSAQSAQAQEASQPPQEAPQQ
ncbi:HTH domain-containing protein [Bifidobacterium samirii]|uniref:Transposase n=1 Tax=Bifidobacterium samirii TaxID=2306974 RepID=A0A430FR64_9BIFI|nr:HTH domain-containing protein [Bifidobacterium samirii]RSX55337.1 transposase [Bifidobacterium samirii]